MTERTCSTCQHMRQGDDGVERCLSPQIIAAYGGATRALFERDSYENEYNRDREATRKCGTAGINHVRRTA